MSFISFQATVTATATPLPSNSVIKSITISAPSGNSGVVVLGNSTSSSTSNSYTLAAGQSVTIELQGGNTNSILIVGTLNDKVLVIGA